MRAQLRHRVILVAVVDDRAVVAGEDDERAIGELQAIERGQDLADAPVHLRDDVAARAHPRLAAEARVRHARHMDVVEREHQEERLVPVLAR